MKSESIMQAKKMNQHIYDRKSKSNRLYGKAKRKRIMKKSKVRATQAQERLFIETSEPYLRFIGGSK